MGISPSNSLLLSLVTVLACDSNDPMTADSGASPADATFRQDSGPVGPDAQVCNAKTLVVNFEGISVSPGVSDDSRNRISAAALFSGTLAAFDDTEMNTNRTRSEVISDIMAGFETTLAPYAVEVVLEPPATGDYTLLSIGGDAAPIGQSATLSNLALLDCNNTNDANMGFVFTGAPGLLDPPDDVYSYEEQVDIIVGLGAKAFGFGLGLDHVSECGDVMSYESSTGCSSVTFQDQAHTCGTDSAQDCVCGGTDQNSHSTLLSLLGATCS